MLLSHVSNRLLHPHRLLRLCSDISGRLSPISDFPLDSLPPDENPAPRPDHRDPPPRLPSETDKERDRQYGTNNAVPKEGVMEKRRRETEPPIRLERADRVCEVVGISRAVATAGTKGRPVAVRTGDVPADPPEKKDRRAYHRKDRMSTRCG